MIVWYSPLQTKLTCCESAAHLESAVACTPVLISLLLNRYAAVLSTFLVQTFMLDTEAESGSFATTLVNTFIGAAFANILLFPVQYVVGGGTSYDLPVPSSSRLALPCVALPRYLLPFMITNGEHLRLTVFTHCSETVITSF